MRDPLYLAWLAGFVDGEGCFHIRRTVSKRTGRISYRQALLVKNADLAVLQEMHRTFGVGNVYPTRGGKDHWVQTWTYIVAGNATNTVVEAIRPYLRVKAHQADVLLSFVMSGYTGGTPAPILRAQTDLFDRLHALKSGDKGGWDRRAALNS